MKINLTESEIETIVALAKANKIDVEFVEKKLLGARCCHDGSDGSLRILYEECPEVPKLVQLPIMATARHSPQALTYVVLWVGPDKKTPYELECFRIDGSDPGGLPRLGDIGFSDYYEEFQKEE